MRRDVRRDLCRYRLAVRAKVGSLFRGHVLASEWRIGQRLFRAQQHRSHGRIALPLLNPPGCEDMRLKSSEDVSIETRYRLHALGKRDQSRAALGHGAEPRHSRREHIAVAVKPSVSWSIRSRSPAKW